MSTRALTTDEISQLQSRGCSAEQWDSIKVHPDFSPEWCQAISFSGTISIGKLGQPLSNMIVPKKSGLTSAHLHNVTIEDGVYINGIKNHIANYTIEKNVFLENINTIEVTGDTAFGNGVMVNTLNEQGGRAIPITTSLSAQIAYMLVFYRHKPQLIKTLQAIIAKEVKALTHNHGTIGTGSRIINTGIISNVQIGPYSDIHNTQRLKNGTIAGTKEAPVIIGTDVIADDFIITENSELHDRAIISKCFIGSGCLLSREFSAEHSLFFANFIGLHGEAFSVFAGPHTVTHHKSTLLIGAYFSFLNAGSGSNQSNNRYKLGPLHQGVIERGSKTASDSYVLWPARVGAFTLITGRHTNHSDTTKLPYSYLVEQDNETLCIPGVNYKSIGTIRDADKWPLRDKRTENSHDIINYHLLSPYSVGKMEEGFAILTDLNEHQLHNNSRGHHYNGVLIPTAAAEKGAYYYKQGIIKYLGNTLVKRLFSKKVTSSSELHELLSATSSIGTEVWVDMAGLIAPANQVRNLTDSIEDKTVKTMADILKAFKNMHSKYHDWAWNWCAPRIEEELGVSINEMTKEHLGAFLEQWQETSKTLDDYFMADAKKEFNKRSQIGFGIDGGIKEQKADFFAVRGQLEGNDFMQRIKSHIMQTDDLYTEAKALIKTYF